MTYTISGYHGALLLNTDADNPTTITPAGVLTVGLSVSYTGLGVVNAGTIDGGTNYISSLGLELAASTINTYGYGAKNYFGINFLTAGSVTNQSGGVIDAFVAGIYSYRAAVTVVNGGRIAADGLGLYLGWGGSVTNQNGGAITGWTGIWDGGRAAMDVVNAGTIAGIGFGLILFGGGSVTNQSGGTISGGKSGIVDSGGALTVVNAGSIAGTEGYGVALEAGGSVTNQSGGAISGYFGILGQGGAVTVVNAGRITANGGDGVYVTTLGSVTNQSGGTITGYFGIFGNGAAVTVVNAGRIAGTGADGVLLLLDGSVTNQSGGVISGQYGIAGFSGAVTVVNAGTITGDNAAVLFKAGYANRLVIDPGAVFSGMVTGGNTIGSAVVSTLELASGASAGTLSGLGTQFIDFAQVTVDVGAQFTLTDDILAAGATLTNAGSLQGPLTLAPGGVLSNASTGTIRVSSGNAVYGQAGGAATVVNAGVIANSNLSSGQGIDLAGGGSVTNQSGGAITGFDGVFGEGVALTVVNAGRITGSDNGVGVDLGNVGSVINQIGGAISGDDGIVGTRALTVVNAGSITGAAAGVYLFARGSITNQSGGAISGDDGIFSEGALAVVNAGSITAAYFGVVLNAGGSVTNQSGGAITGQFGIVGQDSAVTVVNAGSIAGSYYGVVLSVGGSVTNQSGGAISGGYGVLSRGGAATVVNAGTIVGGNYAVKFATESANRLIADPGAVFTGNVEGGGGVLELASAASAGTLAGLGTSITNFSTLQFDSGAQWTVSGNDAASGLGTIGITGFTIGDTIDLTGFLASGETFANNTLVLTGGVGGPDTLNIQGAFTTSSFQLTPDGNGGTDIVVVCFCAGTMIATPAGEVPVETLNIGDLVLTAHNGPRPVKWIGHGKVLATRGRRTAATPVIVRKGALADNVPYADLRMTKAHALYIDDVLIPVEFLVNHRTILWDDRAQEVDIYHVELDSHDVLLANGAPAESFRDDGNRWLFHNARSGWDLPPQGPCAPVLTGGPVVDGMWRRLLDRAGPRDLPPMTDDPDLHLIVDGARVDAEERQGPVYVFRLPHSPGRVVIASREAVPAEFGIARDPRSLGVALRRVAIRQGRKFVVFKADDKRLTAGFHDYEPADGVCWTDGYAELPAEAFTQFAKGAEVMLHLGGATQYPDDRASVARAAA